MSSKLSIMAFPQKQVGAALFLNVMIVVRNYDPTLDDGLNALSPAWQDCRLRLQAVVIDSLTDYPRLDLPNIPFDLPAVQMPNAAATDIFAWLKTQFTLSPTPARAITGAVKDSNRVHKYLPHTYRNAFNFISPRDKNIGMTGDEYFCAVKKNSQLPLKFKPDSGDVSWGKIFAYCLRHKELAKKCGFIFENLEIHLPANTYQHGGWLYVDLHPECSYFSAAQNDQTFAKRYAARIPPLDLNGKRILFTPVAFPVLIEGGSPKPDYPLQPSTAILDQMYLEAAEYDDGFCKIVHHFQPVNGHLLKEEQDEEHPVVNDTGIRLGWDDEQLLTWYDRQLGPDPDPARGGVRPDAPVGVLQYRIDVREKVMDEDPPNPWTPLCRVRADKDIVAGNNIVLLHKNDEMEKGVEVYPCKLDGHEESNFWLPSYFSQWIGNSLVLQDEDAIAIYQKDRITANHTGPSNIYDPPGEQPFKAAPSDLYKAAGLEAVPLLYGHQYEFRVRMADTTGGGPTIDDEPVYNGPYNTTTCNFVRYVTPQVLNFVTPLPQDTVQFNGNVLSMNRPLLGYPSVLFTGAYPNAVQQLIADGAAVIQNDLRRDIGLYDPDVDRVVVMVEIRALGMDTTIRKRDAKDAYALLYTTERSFDGAIDSQLDLPFTFIDAPVLSFVDSQHLPDLGLLTSGDSNINLRKDLVLPTARDIRITVRAMTVNKAGYYGFNPDKTQRNTLKGLASSFTIRRPAGAEFNLFKLTAPATQIRGIYLQPEEPVYVKPKIDHLLVAKLADDTHVPSLMDRLSAAIGCNSKGMALTGRQGQRWQFGVSRHIRHTAAPDNTSITLATKDDLLNHWIIPITLLIDRDWTWDGLHPVSIQVYRRSIFLRDAMLAMSVTDRQQFLDAYTTADIFANAAVQAAAVEALVGDLELKHAINIQALVQADRSQTFACFIDALEPKQPVVTQFPDELFVSYRLAVNYQEDNGNTPGHDPDQYLYLHLPVTTMPKQMPKIVSAGMAFSKYVRDENYANTETRKRYLWVEFDRPPENPGDEYFVRLLAYAPDTLLANWELDLFLAPQEPPLPIDPEFIRIISSASSDDEAGLDAMQPMTRATDSDVHYLIPLPEGLHPESAELFGFFTYEFRVGHKVPWSTAQGRWGRPLRNTGVQHPLPQLYCAAERNQDFIAVTAPFAQTVFDGRNVTARPPRTELWALLYAQVWMADGSDERNVLLSDKKLFIPREDFSYKGFTFSVSGPSNSDATPQGLTGWSNAEVESLLLQYGLPTDSSLSVLVVEMLPGYEHFLVNTDQEAYAAYKKAPAVTTSFGAADFQRYITESQRLIEQTRSLANSGQAGNTYLFSVGGASGGGARPLSTDLGNYRILRTSLLVAVPAVCCTNT